jgi:MFS family permease
MVDEAKDHAKAPAKPAGWRQAVRGNVLAMGLVSLFTDFSSEMMNPLLPIFVTGLVFAPGMSPEQAVALAAIYLGAMEGVAEATASLLKVFAGGLSDRLGKRKALVLVGYGLSAVARPAMGAVGAAWQTVALKFFDRVGKGVRTAPRDALIGDSVGPEVRGLAFSFHRSMDHAGAVAGPLVAIAILAAFLGPELAQTGRGAPTPEEMAGLRWLFLLAIVPGLAAVGALLFKVREVGPAPAKEGEKAAGWRDLPRRFFVFVGAVGVFALGNTSDMFIVLLAQARYGLSLLGVLGLWVLLHVSKIVFSIPGGMLSDRLGRRGVIIAGWVIYAGVYSGLALVPADAQWAFWALLLAYGAFYGLTEGAEKALVTDLVPSRLRGTAFGLYHGAIGVAALSGNALFGVLWHEAGPAWAFGAGAGFAALAVVLLAALLGTPSPPQSTEVKTNG